MTESEKRETLARLNPQIAECVKYLSDFEVDLYLTFELAFYAITQKMQATTE